MTMQVFFSWFKDVLTFISECHVHELVRSHSGVKTVRFNVRSILQACISARNACIILSDLRLGILNGRKKISRKCFLYDYKHIITMI